MQEKRTSSIGALVHPGDQPDVPHHLSRSGEHLDRGAGDQKEFGFDNITMGVHLQRLRLGLCAVSGARRLAQRSLRRAQGAGGHRRLLVAHDRGDRLRPSAQFVCRACAFCSAPAKPARFRARRAPCRCGIRARSAASCKASRIAPAGSAPPSRRPSRADHAHARLALGVLHLRRGRHPLVGMVVLQLSQPAGRARLGERARSWNISAALMPTATLNPPQTREGAERAVGHAAALVQYVGDHVRLLHLRLLPVDLPDLAGVLSGRRPAFQRQGRPVSLAAAVGRRRRQYRRRPGDRLAAAKTGSTRFARRSVAITGLLVCAVFIVTAALTEDAYTAVYCLTGAVFFLECTIGPSWSVPMDTGGKYSGTVSGHDEHGRQHRRRAVADRVRLLAQSGNWQAPFIVAASLLVLGSRFGASGSIPSARWWRNATDAAPAVAGRRRITTHRPARDCASGLISPAVFDLARVTLAGSGFPLDARVRAGS